MKKNNISRVVHKKASKLPNISIHELELLLRKTRQDFPEINTWVVRCQYKEIPAYAQIRVKKILRSSYSLSYPGTATVVIHPLLCQYTRRALCSFIAHELAHLLFISKGCLHTETDIGIVVIDRGYGDGIEETLLKECTQPCYGFYRRILGGVDCRLFCPYKKLIPKNIVTSILNTPNRFPITIGGESK